MMRAAIRRWLGIHDDSLIREAIWAEIDADRVWRGGMKPGRDYRADRRALRDARLSAIKSGYREEPGAYDRHEGDPA